MDGDSEFLVDLFSALTKLSLQAHHIIEIISNGTSFNL